MSHNHKENDPAGKTPTESYPMRHTMQCLNPSPPHLTVIITDPCGRQRLIHLHDAVDLVLGRSEQAIDQGGLIQDPHLAPEHARFKSSSKDHYLVPCQTHNGVYVRLFGEQKLSAGDQLIAGGCHLHVVATSDLHAVSATPSNKST